MKKEVVRRFLKFAAHYVPLSALRLATLGGQGWEFDVWKEVGIPDDHGWIIERDRRATRDLIQRFSYRYCPRLSMFPRVLERSDEGPDYIDALHLDLCGTLEPNFDEVKPVVSLVATQPHGRCLAVTVADARRNRTLEAFPAVKASLASVMGSAQTEEFFASLLAEQRQLQLFTGPRPAFMQPADPEKGARRELGFFWQLVRLLMRQGREIVALPDQVERYVYISRYGRAHPFRMRTYFFHFEPLAGLRNTAAIVRKMAAHWQKRRLEVLRETVLIVPEPAQEVPMAMVSREDFSHLASLARAAGGACQQEFEELLRQVRLVPALEQAYRHLSDVFGSPAPQPPAATSPSVNGASEELKVVQAQLELLRSAADNNGSPSSDCHQRVRRMLGLESRQFSKVFRRKLGGYYANMQGKFRPKFLRRVMKVLGVAVFEELAPLYTRITGQQVTVEVLRQEAAQ